MQRCPGHAQAPARPSPSTPCSWPSPGSTRRADGATEVLARQHARTLDRYLAHSRVRRLGC
ncbi:MAG: hypothetical protein U0797_28845 [Gemmataceae bacterium]